MDAGTRQAVRQRAGDRCEYCGLPQASAPFFTFHVEHIRARQHGGHDELSNLALACPDCNRFKGPNLAAIDPQADQLVPLFNPRIHPWQEHFAREGPYLRGKSPIGRATAGLLGLNEEERVIMRAELIALGQL